MSKVAGLILDCLYVLCDKEVNITPKGSNIQRACELALSHMDWCLRSENYEQANDFLKEADTSKLHPAVLVSIVSMISSTGDELSDKANFIAKTESRMIEEFGEERANKLLQHRR